MTHRAPETNYAAYKKKLEETLKEIPLSACLRGRYPSIDIVLALVQHKVEGVVKPGWRVVVTNGCSMPPLWQRKLNNGLFRSVDTLQRRRL